MNNFLGLSASYNGEWWFLQSYVCAIITYPVIEKIIKKYSAITNICCCVIWSVFLTNLFPALGELEALGKLKQNYLYRMFLCQSAPYAACFWMGCVMAKENLLCYLEQRLHDHNLLGLVPDMIWLGTLLYLRNTGIGISLDIIFVPVLCIVVLDLTKRIRIFERGLYELGKESTNMWLIHSYFCYHFLPVIYLVTLPKYAPLSLLVLILLSYAASVAVTKIWSTMKVVIGRKL